MTAYFHGGPARLRREILPPNRTGVVSTAIVRVHHRLTISERRAILRILGILV